MPLVNGVEIPKRDLIRGKACRNCAGPVPKSSNPANTRKKDFCRDACRKEFHKNNGITVHRLKAYVQGWVRETLKEELAKLGIPGRAA